MSGSTNRITRKSLADDIDALDGSIKSLNDDKRDAFDDYRAQLVEDGRDKDQVKAEIEAVKSAIRRRRAVKEKGEPVIEAKDALADEVFAEISAARAPRATPARSNTSNDHAKSKPSDHEATHPEPQGVPGDISPAKASTGNDASATTQVVSEPDPPQQVGHGVSGEASRPSDGGGTVAPNSEPDGGFAGIAAKAEAKDDLTPIGKIVAKVQKDFADAKALRPYCLKPGPHCGGQGRTHCYSCQKAHADAEGEPA